MDKCLVFLYTEKKEQIMYVFYSLLTNNDLVLIRLALNTMTLQVSSINVNSGQGVSISVTGIAQVRDTRKIGAANPFKVSS